MAAFLTMFLHHHLPSWPLFSYSIYPLFYLLHSVSFLYLSVLFLLLLFHLPVYPPHPLFNYFSFISGRSLSPAPLSPYLSSQHVSTQSSSPFLISCFCTSLWSLVILVLLLYFLFIIPTIFSFSSYFSCSFTLFHSILSSSLSIYVYVSFVYFSPPFFVHHFLLLDHILFTINLIFNPPPPSRRFSLFMTSFSSYMITCPSICSLLYSPSHSSRAH